MWRSRARRAREPLSPAHERNGPRGASTAPNRSERNCDHVCVCVCVRCFLFGDRVLSLHKENAAVCRRDITSSMPVQCIPAAAVQRCSAALQRGNSAQQQRPSSPGARSPPRAPLAQQRQGASHVQRMEGQAQYSRTQRATRTRSATLACTRPPRRTARRHTHRPA